MQIMREIDVRSRIHEAPPAAFSLDSYRDAFFLLNNYVAKDDVTNDVYCVADVFKGAAGLGYALDVVIRENGRRIRGIDGAPDHSLLQRNLANIPTPLLDSAEGRFTAITDGVVVILAETPRKDPEKLPPVNIFLTLPVRDQDWKKINGQTPSITLGNDKTQYLLNEPSNSGLAQVFASTLRQFSERVISAVAHPPVPRHAKKG